MTAADPLDKLKRMAEAVPMIASDSVLNSLAAWEKERAELLAEVREWMCGHCRTVYPGPPQHGVRCVVCPQCKGPTAPRSNIILYAALRAEVLKVAEEMEIESGWPAVWRVRLRKACE